MSRSYSNITCNKSSSIFLLLFCFAFFNASANLILPSDTIRLDGILIEIEQVETPVILPLVDEDPNIHHKPLELSRFFYQASAGSGLSWNSNQYLGPDNIESLDYFVNKDLNFSMYYTGEFLVGKRLSDNFLLLSGIGVSFLNLSSKKVTDPTLLDPDVVGFIQFNNFYTNGEGELFENVRFDLDPAGKDSNIVIGIEKQKTKATFLRIPLLVGFNLPIQDKSRYHLEPMVGLTFNFLTNPKDFNYSIINSEGYFSEEVLASGDFVSMVPSLSIRMGVEIKLGKDVLRSTTSLYSNFSTDFMITPLSTRDSNLEINQANLGVNLGLRWYLSKKD